MAATVILDVDGTLVDTSYLHTMAWWYACREHGVDRTMATIHHLVGMGGDQLVPALVGHVLDGLEEAHGRHYGPHLHEASALPGAAELIGELHRRGATVALATSSGKADLDVLLRAITTRDLLDVVVTMDDARSSKPAPDLAAVAMARCDSEPETTVFVGDTGWDVEAAARAGVPCVCVRSGGWSECELLAAGAIEVYADAADLLMHIDDGHIGAILREAR